MCHAVERRTRTSATGDVQSDVRSHVLDWGCAPGAEDELADLICAAAGALPEATTHLTVWALPRSRLFQALREVASSVELYDLFVMLTDGEADLSRGACVDAAMI